MIRGGFLDASMREDLIALVRDGKAETRLTRRANALLLLDDGMSCEAIAKVLYLDDDTIRYWYKLYGEKGLSWLADFGYKGRACELTAAQQDGLKDWVAQTLPRTSTTVGEWIEKSYGVSYTRSALVKLLARLELEYRKPQVIPRKLDPAKQKAFIEAYENLLNTLGDDEAVLFADAVHPTHAVRPAGCWAPKDAKVALEQSSGRQRLNIHGAIDLETGATRMIEATTIDALSTIALLMAIALMYPTKRLIHVFLDNAKYVDVLPKTRAGACLIAQRFESSASADLCILVARNPYRAFVTVARALFPEALRPSSLFAASGVSPGALIHSAARLESGVTVDPGAVIGRHEVGALPDEAVAARREHPRAAPARRYRAVARRVPRSGARHRGLRRAAARRRPRPRASLRPRPAGRRPRRARDVPPSALTSLVPGFGRMGRVSRS